MVLEIKNRYLNISKFVLEAERLEDICPSFVARSVIIFVESPGNALPTLI